ncbi:hypothetical protein FO521_29375 [Bacillus pseudomycoides]|nr:hypothetical protein [Bacillus pseudomycoides]
MLNNPGFDDGATGGVIDWNSSPTGATVVDTGTQPDNNSHSGVLTSPTGARIQAVAIEPGAFITQSVHVDPGCCYTLSFAASSRANALLVASVAFSQNFDCVTPPSPANIVDLGIPNIVPNNHHPQSTFSHYTLVVCVPAGATRACISFQNIPVQGQGVGSTAFIDNVVFQPTGGGCDPNSCVQNF